MDEKILIVEDEPRVVLLVSKVLEAVGYSAIAAASGESALELFALEQPDLVLLDILLPHGPDGYEICRRIREFSDIPVIMLTAKARKSEVLQGFDVGADDYLTKPFDAKELVARVRAVIRRNVKETDEDIAAIRIRDVVIHPGRHEVFVNGNPVRLTFTEFGILNVLARKPGWVFGRAQILDAVRGEDYFVNDRSVDVQILGLRKKLGHAGKYIETVRGVGYRIMG